MIGLIFLAAVSQLIIQPGQVQEIESQIYCTVNSKATGQDGQTISFIFPAPKTSTSRQSPIVLILRTFSDRKSSFSIDAASSVPERHVEQQNVPQPPAMPPAVIFIGVNNVSNQESLVQDYDKPDRFTYEHTTLTSVLKFDPVSHVQSEEYQPQTSKGQCILKG